MVVTQTKAMPKGKGPKGLDWAGVYPAACVVWKDKNCRELDEEPYRALLRNLLEPNIRGLYVSSAHEGLTREEQNRVIRIAKEEAKDRVPVTGRAFGEWTWQVIEDGKASVDAGADILYIHQTYLEIPGWPPDESAIVDFYKRFDKAVRAPFIAVFWGSPGLLKKITVECENVVGYKLAANYNLWHFKQWVEALKEAEAETGRHACALLAGDHGLAEVTINGGEGNVNGGAAWRGREDAAIYHAAKNGDYKTAFEIQNRIAPASDAVRGMFGSRTVNPLVFEYRFKVMSWFLGKIPRPYSRPPLVLPPKEEIIMLRERLIKSGMNVVHKAEEIEDS